MTSVVCGMKMSETFQFVKGSENVFLDMGFSETEVERERLRCLRAGAILGIA